MKTKANAYNRLLDASTITRAKIISEQNFILGHVLKEAEFLESEFDAEKATLEEFIQSIKEDILVCCLAQYEVTIVCGSMLNLFLMELQEKLAAQCVNFNIRVTHFVQFHNRATLLLNKCTDLSEVLDVVLLSYKFNVDEHIQTHHAVPKPIIL